jgi:hypothetical protein
MRRVVNDIRKKLMYVLKCIVTKLKYGMYKFCGRETSVKNPTSATLTQSIYAVLVTTLQVGRSRVRFPIR